MTMTAQPLFTTAAPDLALVPTAELARLRAAAAPLTDDDIGAVARETVGASWERLGPERQDEAMARVLDVLSALSVVRPAIVLVEGEPDERA